MRLLQEPSIEEAQPAWWLELKRAEELQREVDENGCFQEHTSSPKPPSFGSKGETRTVRFAGEPVAGSGACCYENDSEFVIARPETKPAENPAVQTLQNEQLKPWDLVDLADVEGMRHALLQPIEGSNSFEANSCSHLDSRAARYACSSPPSDAEKEFSVFKQNLAHGEQYRFFPD